MGAARASSARDDSDGWARDWARRVGAQARTNRTAHRRRMGAMIPRGGQEDRRSGPGLALARAGEEVDEEKRPGAGALVRLARQSSGAVFRASLSGKAARAAPAGRGPGDWPPTPTGR